MAEVQHSALTDAQLHVPGYVQAVDPGAVGAGMCWIDTGGGAGHWAIKVRNAADLAWEVVGVPDHGDLAGVVANQHIDHTAVVLTAGAHLSGGGDISANRSFAVDDDFVLNTGDQIDGNLIIDNTGSEVFLIRKNADGGDFLTADTNTGRFIITQIGDSNAIRIFGYDDKSAEYLYVNLNSVGDSYITSSLLTVINPIAGGVVIDGTNAEMLLVRKDTDGGDVLVVDTVNSTITLPNTGLHILDTNASHDLIIAPGSDLTADRQLTLTTGDAARTITLSGNPTLGDWFDQSVKQAGSPTFVNQTLTGNFTIPTTTTAALGVILKGASRFIHDFHHPSGNTAIPAGSNVFVGINAGNFTIGSGATTTYMGSYNTAVGDYTLFRLTLGAFNLAVGGSALAYLTIGNTNMALGFGALQYLTTSNNNVGVGANAGAKTVLGANNETTSSSVYVGYNTTSSVSGVSNEIVLGTTATGQGSNTIMLGNSSITGLYCYDTTISSPSDRRIKKNITPIGNMLDFINELEPITYNKINPKDWDKKFRTKKSKKIKGEPEIEEYITEDNLNTYAGLIAQDVALAMKKHGVDYELVPELNNGMLALRYGDLIPALIGAVKELAQKVELLY